jgi:hypothetical protein
VEIDPIFPFVLYWKSASRIVGFLPIRMKITAKGIGSDIEKRRKRSPAIYPVNPSPSFFAFGCLALLKKKEGSQNRARA